MTTWNRSLPCQGCECCPGWVCDLARRHGTECWAEAPGRISALLCPCSPLKPREEQP